jgi:hypothetical protein
LWVLDEQVGYAGWERGRERERKQGEKKRERDRKEAVREINREREWKRYGERESEWVREREGDGGEREIQVIVWSCRVNSLRMLGERDRGKEGGREGENEWGRDFWAKERESEGEREIGER